MTLLQRWKQTALHNKALVLTSVLLALSTVLYTGAAFFQIYLMNRSADESAKQIERLIGATNMAIGRAVEQEKVSVQSTLRQNRDAMSGALAQTQASLNASVAQSKAALDASIEIFRGEQRAWVTVKTYEVVFNGATGTRVRIRLVNTGRTPARAARSAFDVQVTMADRPPVFNKYLTASISSPVYAGSRVEAIIPPLGESSITGDPNDARIPDAVLQLIRTGARHFYITGTIWYNDVFEKQHVTEYCAVYYAATGTFDPCTEGHNTAN